MKFSKSFIIGSVATLGLVAVSSVAFAQTVTTIPAPTLDPVACSAALDAQNSAMGPAMDALNTATKAALSTKTTALKAAVALTDVTQRNTAIKAANEAFRTAQAAAMTQFQTATKTTMDALRTACPGLGGGRGMGMGPGMGMGGMRGGPEKDDDSTTNPAPKAGIFGKMGAWMHGGKKGHGKGQGKNGVPQVTNNQ